MLQMDFEPEGAVEKVGDALGVVNRRVKGDLERFKELIESRGDGDRRLARRGLADDHELSPRQTSAAGMRLGFAVKVLGDGGLPSHDTRRWQSGPHLSRLARPPRGDPRLPRPSTHRHVPDGDGAGPVRLAPRPAAVPRPAARVRAQLADGRRAGPRAGRAAVDASRPVHGAQLRGRARPGGWPSTSSRSRPSCSTAWGSGPRRSSCSTWAARRAAARPALERFERGFERLSERRSARLVIENDDRTFGAERRARACAGASAGRSCGTSCTTTATTPTGSPTARRSRWRRDLARGRAAEDALLVAAHRRRGAPSARSAGASSARSCCRRCALTPTWSTRSPSSTSCADTAAGVDVDVMLEAKAKDLALLRLREQLAARGLEPERAAAPAG